MRNPVAKGVRSLFEKSSAKTLLLWVIAMRRGHIKVALNPIRLSRNSPKLRCTKKQTLLHQTLPPLSMRHPCLSGASLDAGRAGVGDQRGGDKIPCLFACFLLVKPFSFHGKENSLKRTFYAKVLLSELNSNMSYKSIDLN